MKFKFSQGSKTKSQQGFSMLETMIAALISLIFMSLGANLVLAANLQKVVAKRSVAMNNFIQSDVEAIKYQSNLIAKNPDMCASKSTVQANPQLGYAGALRNKFRPSTAQTTTNTIDTNDTTTTTVKILNQNYTMTRTLGPIPSSHSGILPISYQFKRTGYTPIEHELYVEVLMNAVFSC
jgi:prepilin-type N-terminal cleavage/methylation domain-containing protein